MIEISDTGIGMSEELLRRIYLPFERATDDKNTEGVWLGLTITKGLVTLLNGTIDVKSKLGCGSTFTVILPLPTSDENIDDEDVVFDDSMHLPQNVIAIDDDSFQLEVIKDMLLTDIQMPGTNGFELLRLLRRSRIGNSEDIPVVAGKNIHTDRFKYGT